MKASEARQRTRYENTKIKKKKTKAEKELAAKRRKANLKGKKDAERALGRIYTLIKKACKNRESGIEIRKYNSDWPLKTHDEEAGRNYLNGMLAVIIPKLEKDGYEVDLRIAYSTDRRWSGQMSDLYPHDFFDCYHISGTIEW